MCFLNCRVRVQLIWLKSSCYLCSFHYDVLPRLELLKLNVYMKHLGILLKCSFWFSSTEAWGVAFLTTFLEIPMLLVWRPHLSIKEINKYFPLSPFFKLSNILLHPYHFLSDDLASYLTEKTEAFKRLTLSYHPLNPTCPHLLCLPTCNHRWNIHAPIQNKYNQCATFHLPLLTPGHSFRNIFLSTASFFPCSVLICFHQHDIQTSLFLLRNKQTITLFYSIPPTSFHSNLCTYLQKKLHKFSTCVAINCILLILSFYQGHQWDVHC